MTDTWRGSRLDDGSGRGATAPRVSVVPTLRAASGSTLRVPVRVTNRASVERAVVVTAVGVDPAWLGVPARTLPLAPGAAEVVELELTPPQGTLPASYPLVVTGLAVDPVTGRTDAASSRPGQAESTLVVSPRSRLTIELEPPELRAISSRKVTAVLRNSGGADAQVALQVTHPRHGRVKFRRPQVVVPPDGEVRVTGRARLNRPRLLGYGARHAYRVTASTPESVRHAQGTLEQRAVFGPWGLKAVAILCVVAVWLGGAGFLVAKISQSQREKSQEDTAALADAGSEGGDDAAGEDAGDEGSDDGGEDAAGEAGGEDAEGGESAPPLQLAGTVVDQPGVTVRMESTSLVDEEAQGASGIGVDDEDLDGDGKRPAAAFSVSASVTAAPERLTTTADDGTWAMSDVKAPGYYLLTFSKPGFQTERYVVDSSSEAAKEPLEIELESGAGSLSGRIRDLGGNGVGGATITITDGVNTLTTSSTSEGGGRGAWSIDGLSAPGTYVVSATRHDMSSEARVVEVRPFESARADLTLSPGSALVQGKVRTPGLTGRPTPLGGATVTVTDGADLQRVATTLTVDPRGRFYLPALPAPGTYTATVTADGYQVESLRFSVPKGRAGMTLPTIDLDSVYGRIGGRAYSISAEAQGAKVSSTRRVRKADLPAGAVPQPGVGITLANDQHAYKTTTSSQSDGPSRFAFDAVAPGVYTLTASYFNHFTVQRTVHVRPGPPQGDGVDLVLRQHPDGPLPSTAKVSGKVVDALTADDIATCTADRVTDGDVERCVSASMLNPDDDSPRTTFSSAFASDGSFTLPSPADCAALAASDPQGTCGLEPGLHTITIKAPGYEEREVDVEVGLGGTTTVPDIELTRVPTLTGTVRMTLDGARLPATCVWLLPRGASTSGLPLCEEAIDPGDASNEERQADDDACLPGIYVDNPSSASRNRWCAYTTNARGTYTIEAPTAGDYTVVVRSSQTQYVVRRDLDVTLVSGQQERHFDLERLPIINVLLRQPAGRDDSDYTDDDGTQILVPAAGGTLKLTGENGSVPLDDADKTAEADGTRTLTHLRPGTYTVDGSSAEAYGAVAGLHNGRSTAAVEYNDEIDLVVDLTDRVSSFTGRIQGLNADGTLTDVPGATVTVRGGTGFTSSGLLNADSPAVVVSDADGCFGIAVTVEPQSTTECGAITGNARAAQPFVTTRMPQVDVVATTDDTAAEEARGWQETHPTNYFMPTGGTRADIVLVPEPIAVQTTPDFEIDVAGADTLPDDVDVKVVPLDDPTRSVEVTVAEAPSDSLADDSRATYRLDWSDSAPIAGPLDDETGEPLLELPDGPVDLSPGEAAPGQYRITVDHPDFTGSTRVMTCTRVPSTCTLQGGPLTLERDGSVVVTVVDADTDLPVSNADVDLTGAGDTKTRKGSTDNLGVVTLGALKTGRKPNLAFSVKASGYAFGSSAVPGSGVETDCQNPDVRPGLPLACTVEVVERGTIEGTLRAIRAVDQPGVEAHWVLPTNVEITAECIAGSCMDGSPQEFTVKTVTKGEFKIQGSGKTVEGPRPGTFRLEAPEGYPSFEAGLDADSRPTVTVADDDTVRGVVKLFAKKVQFKTLVVDSADAPVAGATVWLSRESTLTSDPAATSPRGVESPAGSGTYAFRSDDEDGVYPGPWYVHVKASGVRRYAAGWTLSDQDPTDPDKVQSTTVRVERVQGTVTGTVTATTSGAPLAGASVAICAADVTTVTECFATPAPGADGSALVDETDETGTYEVTGVRADTYAVAFKATGYNSTLEPLSVSDDAESTVSVTLDEVTWSLAVTVEAHDAEPLSGFVVSFEPDDVDAQTPAFDVEMTDGTVGTDTVTTLGTIRPGCYFVRLTMPEDGGHHGLPRLPVDDACTPPAGAGSILVPAATTDDQTLPVTVDVDSVHLDYTTTATPMFGHDAPALGEGASTLRVDGPGGEVTQEPLLDEGDLFLAPDASYTVTPELTGVPTDWWDAPALGPVQTGAAGSTLTHAFKLTEKTVTVSVSVAGLADGVTAEVEVSPASAGASAPTDAVQDVTSTSPATFVLGYGDWKFDGVWDDGESAGTTYETILDPGAPQPIGVVIEADGP